MTQFWAIFIQDVSHSLNCIAELMDVPRGGAWHCLTAYNQDPSRPHICYHVKFGSSATYGILINKKEPPKLGSTGTMPPWDGA